MASSSQPFDMSLEARRARHGRVSTTLALLSDRRLGDLMDSASPLGEGIGGTTWLLEVDGGPVFVKRVALTDLERRPENSRSTANLFGLPAWSHYGVGSAGGGAWRELAAHAMTSDWALTGQCENFLLLHHWRVLSSASPRPATAAERAELDRNVAFWHDDPGVRQRLEALTESSADLVLFLEHVPHNLLDWLTTQGRPDDHEVDAACALAERDLRAVTSFMGAHGLQHFDAHFRNILTDGERLFVTDFGLASSSRFELSRDERRFLEEHTSHDECYVVTQLVNWVVSALSDAGRQGWAHPRVRNEFVHRCAEGQVIPELPPHAAAIVQRYAPVAVVVNDFYFKLHLESRKTPYPANEIEQSCAMAGFEPVSRTLLDPAAQPPDVPGTSVLLKDS
jgi:hypothetical protein